LFIQLKNPILQTIVRFEVLKAASMKMAVLWVVTQCSLAEVYRRFGGAFYLRRQDDMKAAKLRIKAGRTSETSVKFYQTTRRNFRFPAPDISLL
jgi:membrane protease subunit (stomatin/prohibitin family)